MREAGVLGLSNIEPTIQRLRADPVGPTQVLFDLLRVRAQVLSHASGRLPESSLIWSLIRVVRRRQYMRSPLKWIPCAKVEIGKQPMRQSSRIFIVVEAVEKIRDHLQHRLHQSPFILR